MEDFDELSCYPVRASASGAIAELIEVRVYVMLSMDFTCHLEVGTMLVCHWDISLCLMQNGYAPPDWLVLLQVVMKRISVEDENESTLLFQLLGTIIESGQEKVLPHIPEIVSNIANTIMKLLPPVPDPWPQVIAHLYPLFVNTLVFSVKGKINIAIYLTVPSSVISIINIFVVCIRD